MLADQVFYSKCIAILIKMNILRKFKQNILAILINNFFTMFII